MPQDSMEVHPSNSSNMAVHVMPEASSDPDGVSDYKVQSLTRVETLTQYKQGVEMIK